MTLGWWESRLRRVIELGESLEVLETSVSIDVDAKRLRAFAEAERLDEETNDEARIDESLLNGAPQCMMQILFAIQQRKHADDGPKVEMAMRRIAGALHDARDWLCKYGAGS